MDEIAVKVINPEAWGCTGGRVESDDSLEEPAYSEGST
jgi:hypothetical protein